MTTLLEKWTDKFATGRDLASDKAEELLDAMILSGDEDLLAKLFHAWREKTIAADEIFAISSIMRERCIKITSHHTTFVDIVGTGGSRAKTFNVSTAAAFVAAGRDIPVAKHGNRAATSSTGSSDVLAELGVDPAAEPRTAERNLNEMGLCFLFAPNFHRLSATLAKVRRGLGFPTIFNCVGPLCNPAGPPHQLIGVWDEALLPKMAEAMRRLGTTRSWIVHGKDGLDEISIRDKTKVFEIVGSTISEFDISPSDFDASISSEDVRADSAAESAGIIRAILNGSKSSGPALDLVLVNSAAAIYITGQASSLSEGMQMAAESIKEGHAYAKLKAMSEDRAI